MGACGSHSEIEFQTELNIARVARACDDSKSCIGLNKARRKTSSGRGWVDVKCRRSSGICVLRMIQDIEELRAKLKIRAFVEAEVLENRHVPIVNARTTHDTAARRAVGGERRREGRSVEQSHLR